MTLPKINSDLKRSPKNESKFSRKSLLEKNVVCDLCDVRFTQRKALYVHLRNKHNIEPLEKKEGKVQCPECKNMFYDKYNLKRHYRTAHGVSPTRDGSKIILRGRIVNTNRKPKFIQSIEDNYTSVDKHAADVHLSPDETHFTTNPIEVFICDSCKSRFTSKPDLIQHINNVHTEFKNLRCVECRENFSDKESLLLHTHPIENYNTLEKILPEAYKYEVDKHVQINDASFVSEIYCNLSSRENSEQWLDKFQRKNKVTFRNMRRQCRSFDQSYVVFIDRYRCQHNTLPKRRSTPHAKHTGCSATLFIRVYQNKHIPQLSWSRIRIKHTHNHRTEAAAKFRDPVEEVVNKFRLMFEAGKGPKAALNEHIRDLQLSYGDDVISDRGLCPTSRWVYNFYQKLTKQRFELPVKKKSKPLNSEIANQISCEPYPGTVSSAHLTLVFE
ncbi:uncharacterized protein LOC135832900 isoform X2 [Planococcus citri]|uniref:uncharacterized protein LOC135832900 isoform X2 n=1 Tax=Planococcus citri TaxID=170843 RepID=UPI0031F77259